MIATGAVDAEREATPFTPYRYQQKMMVEAWPDMLDVPTGLGKTAAVTGASLYRRLTETRRRRDG